MLARSLAVAAVVGCVAGALAVPAAAVTPTFSPDIERQLSDGVTPKSLTAADWNGDRVDDIALLMGDGRVLLRRGGPELPLDGPAVVPDAPCTAVDFAVANLDGDSTGAIPDRRRATLRKEVRPDRPTA